MVSDSKLKAAVIEDNPDLNDMLVEDLRAAGYLAAGFRSVEAYEGVADSADIVLLDVNLPGKNGLDFARELRARDKRVGIVVLSIRAGSVNRTTGYQCGVDIYLQKPCGSAEILSAMDRVSERVALFGARQAPIERQHRLLPDRLTLMSDTEAIGLNPREVQFLAALTKAPGRQLAYDACKPHFADDGEIKQPALEVAVGRLRKKIEQATGVAKAIVAVRGAGYRLVLDVAVED